MMPVASGWFGAIRAIYKGATRLREGAASVGSDLVQIASLDKGDQFIPFGMREPDGICILADPDALISDFDLGHSVQSGQRVNLIGSISLRMQERFLYRKSTSRWASFRA